MQDKQQSWCFRLDVEKRLASNSFFVTFTYDDEHLIFADDEACLYKRHVQLFFKSLRKALPQSKIKYYCVGEYGEQWRPLTPKGRPHYHALIFYYGEFDWFRLKMLIKDKWIYGIAQVLPVLGAQGYVTKYILKFDKRDHIVEPFSLISNGLGIGYLSPSMIKYHKDNLLSFATKPGGYRISLPRYYKDKIFTTYDKLVMKSRADLYRREINIKKADYNDLMLKFGVNPFAHQVLHYQHRLYQSMKIYKEKHKL